MQVEQAELCGQSQFYWQERRHLGLEAGGWFDNGSDVYTPVITFSVMRVSSLRGSW